MKKLLAANFNPRYHSAGWFTETETGKGIVLTLISISAFDRPDGTVWRGENHYQGMNVERLK